MTAHLGRRLAELVHGATAGAVTADQALSGGSLRALGLDSLGALRLIDAIDLEFGVEVDLGDGPGADTLDAITRMVAERL
ncbi:acyl carrier protein [Catellatospora sp. KI3]|uniref:acyl carrier protein n=1 Tax=Catellatospora sp. KI3 TaxID=3041620 RepID=UPI00248294E6|nr:acyl carrier protein [Catellatospora sp. KI3]MDI1460948.1 acyl carrier protein [Catellatospora sp. KI3]